MGKTRAEISKAYRERKKLNDPAFLERERKRQFGYRIPASKLSKKKLKTRQGKSRLHSQKYRAKFNRATEQLSEQPNDVSNEVQSQEVSSSVEPDQPSTSTGSRTTSTPLVVKLAFPQHSSSRKKRRSKALRQANKAIKELSTQNSKLQKRVKKFQKRNERLNTRLSRKSDTSYVTPVSEMTPRSKTDTELAHAGIRRSDVPASIRQKLIFANAVTSQIKDTHDSTKSQNERRKMRRLVAGGIIRKYRLINYLHKDTGIRRCSLVKHHDRRTRQVAARTFLQGTVIAFFERDDVSRCMPGKRDAVKIDKEKIQTRILNDYLGNLYGRFQADNPESKLSFAQFCKLRPAYIKLTSLLSRNICLCTCHQNFALKLTCLRSLAIDISPNPETVSKCVTVDEMSGLLSNIGQSHVQYEVWQRIEVNDVKKTRIVKVTKTRDEFITLMEGDYRAFLAHVGRVKQQYKAMCELKKKLAATEVVVQMDFSENFTCQTAEEIQSAYWNSTSVTLHPVIAYFIGPDNKLLHKSFVFVSDLREHNAKSVVAIIKKLVPLLKLHVTDLQMIHYWTDSPSSQYRNRFIFSTVCHHDSLFGVKACWNYFECGHGKGACDGIGGTAKRQAADAVKQGKTIIQDADDFFSWASTHEKEITYVRYSQDDYDESAVILQTIDCKPIPGTMKAHAIIPVDDRHLLTREVSCYCDDCIHGVNRCSGWIVQPLKLHTDTCSVPDHINLNDTTIVPNVGNLETCDMNKNDSIITDAVVHNIAPLVDTYVAAIYSGKWYLGKVLEVDVSDDDALITFMNATKSVGNPRFKWPHGDDQLWIPFKDILVNIETPVAIGRSARFYQIPDETFNKIEKLAHVHKC